MLFYLERIIAVLLTAILIFNLSQRRHLDGGEKKRYASLFLALPFLTFFLGLLIIQRFNLSSSFLFPVFAVSFLVFVYLSRKILIFRFRCPRCKTTYPVKEILYTDFPACVSCGFKEIDWAAWRPTEKAVIVYIVDKTSNRVLLINKKTGLGKGKVNAPGGRLEPGETALEAAVRECREEVGLILDPETLEKRMELHFQFTSGYALYGEAFFTASWAGDLTETEEADPFWCDLDKIPWDKMWEDDAHWLPAALGGKKQRGFYVFDDDKMLSQKLENRDKHPN